MAKVITLDLLQRFYNYLKPKLDRKKDKFIDEKTYENYIYSGENSDVFCIKVTRTSATAVWHVRFKLIATVPDHADVGIYTNYDVDYYGYGDNTKAYYVKVNHGSYCAITNCLAAYPVSSSDNICYLGFSVSSVAGNHYNDSGYARDVLIQLIECEDCEAELLTDLLYWKNMTQASYSERYMILMSNGLQETGDADTHVNQAVPGSLICRTAVQKYGLCGLDADGKLVSISAGNGGISATKTAQTTVGFLPEHLYYRQSALDVAADGTSSGNYVQIESFDLRYCMNWTTALSLYSPLYLVGTIGADGLFYVADVDPWIVNTRTDTTKAYLQFGRIESSDGRTAALYANTYCWVYDEVVEAWVDHKHRPNHAYGFYISSDGKLCQRIATT